MDNELYSMPQSCDFNKAFNGSFEEFECSPKLVDRYFSLFEGLLINAPLEIVWPKGISLNDHRPNVGGRTDGPLRLMLCGTARVKYKTKGLKGSIGSAVLVVAVNQKTGEAFSGKMPRSNYKKRPRRPGDEKREVYIPSEEKLKTVLTSFFTLDLVNDLRLPIADATYHVYATVAEYKSNVITIKTSVEK